jgi:hypothetical protein
MVVPLDADAIRWSISCQKGGVVDVTVSCNAVEVAAGTTTAAVTGSDGGWIASAVTAVESVVFNGTHAVKAHDTVVVRFTTGKGRGRLFGVVFWVRFLLTFTFTTCCPSVFRPLARPFPPIETCLLQFGVFVHWSCGWVVLTNAFQRLLKVPTKHPVEWSRIFTFCCGFGYHHKLADG